MNKWTLLAAIVCCAPGPASADAVTDACMACHKDALSLKGKDTAAVTARLKDMRAGRARHPTPLPNVTEAELEALARALTAQ